MSAVVENTLLLLQLLFMCNVYAILTSQISNGIAFDDKNLSMIKKKHDSWPTVYTAVVLKFYNIFFGRRTLLT